jgi:hypothetical protein
MRLLLGRNDSKLRTCLIWRRDGGAVTTAGGVAVGGVDVTVGDVVTAVEAVPTI